MQNRTKPRDPQILAKSLGAAIAAKRVESGLSQEAVAERLGIGQEAVSRTERGVVTPSLERLLAFSDVFGCRLDELILPASDRPDDQAVQLGWQVATLDTEDAGNCLARFRSNQWVGWIIFLGLAVDMVIAERPGAYADP